MEYNFADAVGAKCETDFFFTTFNDRLHPLNKLWQKALEKHFKRSFTPIYVVPAKSDCLTDKDNYIVLNAKQSALRRKAKDDTIVDLIYPEDLNKQFSDSRFVKKLINNILKHQDHVYIAGFTPVWLNVPSPRVKFLGSDSKITDMLDNKVAHYDVFKAVNLETVPVHVYPSFKKLKKRHRSFPCFVSPSYSSGGIESRPIESADELESYYKQLRPLNRKRPFIVTDFLADVAYSPNTSAFIDVSGTVTLTSVTDQILRGHKYMGNLYPSSLPTELHKKVEDITLRVGEYLATLGFKGFYGLDFVVTDDGRCLPVDLNPRRQGGYYCSVLSSPVDIIDMELKTALGLPIPTVTYKDFQAAYAWGHSKLTPYAPNSRIVTNVAVGNPFDPFKTIGSTYQHIYYPKGTKIVVGNPGFYVSSHNDRGELKKVLGSDVQAIIRQSYVPDKQT